jgi:hypothetical protein
LLEIAHEILKLLEIIAVGRRLLPVLAIASGDRGHPARAHGAGRHRLGRIAAHPALPDAAPVPVFGRNRFDGYAREREQIEAAGAASAEQHA